MKFHDFPYAGRTYPPEGESTKMISFMVRSWIGSVRPYYKVWPSIIDSLLKCSLDFTLAEAKLELRSILVRFPVGHEPADGDTRLLSFLSCYMRFSDCEAMGLETHIARGGNISSSLLWIRTIDAGTIGERVDRMEENSNCDREFNKVDRMAMQAAMLCHLLANDPSIIEPDVLGKDRDRYKIERDEGWKERAVARARRRGRMGWNIGASYETCPHYRRPHFGVRYTGPGGKIPRVVPIKGSVVHRSKLTQVPTGYVLPDGREIET